MAITLDGTAGVTTPGVTNSGNETITGTLGVTGNITGSGLSTVLYPLVSGTAVASTSGTSIDFTSIPSWVKRITVMFNAVSTNGTASYLVQIGSGSVTSSGYTSTSSVATGTNSVASTSSTAGFAIYSSAASDFVTGTMILTLIGGNIWVSGQMGNRAGWALSGGGSSSALAGALDRVRITTVNGTDTFDAGSINLLWE